MGILDDAIREHLDLKRKHGAESDDLDRLEKEAFGPSERPGEPDSREQPLADEEMESADDAPEADSEPQWLEGFDDDDFDPATGEQEQTGEQVPQAVAPEAPSEAPEESAQSGDVTPAERARLDYSDLDDTADHPAVEPGSAPEATPPEPPESAIFDQGGDALELEDMELDLDLDDEDPPAPGAAPSGAALEAEGDDFEFEIPDPDAEENPLPRQPGTEEAPATASRDLEPESGELFVDEEEEDEIEDEDDDLLEETPDFLEDAPEGERLWFEQRGKPKDFDFDD